LVDDHIKLDLEIDPAVDLYSLREAYKIIIDAGKNKNGQI